MLQAPHFDTFFFVNVHGNFLNRLYSNQHYKYQVELDYYVSLLKLVYFLIYDIISYVENTVTI